MHVIATAGHVDHGKSTLVRALTGMEPDRWAEERRRGMTIDLGFAWTTLGSGEVVAFVDVPGHERFVPNMLAGIGPVPAALVVVAADEGWMPQSAEHLAALNALGVSHGLLVVTRSDLFDPALATAEAQEQIAATSLGAVDAVAVSAVTGAGLDDLRAALDALVARLPAPDRDAPVRLWVDRSFTIRGAGTVVTGTLGAGRLRPNDELELAASGRPVRVRGLQSLGAPVAEAAAVARVAVNLRGIERDEVGRGDALVTPGRFHRTDVVDVRLAGDPVADLPSTLTLHVGSAAVAVRIRPLGVDTARLRLDAALPLRVGDRALLRDPGRHHVAGGVTVLDVSPPPLRRRGAAAARARELSTMDGVPSQSDELRRRGLVRRPELERMGVPAAGTPVAGDWLADPDHWSALRKRLAEEVADYARDHPLETGAPVDALRHALGLPDRALVDALVAPPLTARSGRIAQAGQGSSLPGPVADAVDRVRADLEGDPFRAPEAARLAELGLGPRELAAAVRAGALVRVADGVVLLPGALDEAVAVLSRVSQPFTLSDARQALGTSRRVAVPLLEMLDRSGATRRLPDDRRVVAGEVDG
ncbi:selenocysteine-specific translation elongation factor [Planosporangium mesophilum]|uniref:Selenocysteine-specific elongation factor n=1 Tax=Planosporangium mesophilum TaxID=689768 RepID=A0A8J3TCN9_9ACTN|nr:selenocysteine-specific translation elongation factor [Planosporangium mesophilum]NJC84244.1 selenocysteine-specific translation elongation factor [Planosporangium mesophilum]GII23086.1 selenocysteine-specific translation elongation factor [Planosporangium mesophilum]